MSVLKKPVKVIDFLKTCVAKLDDAPDIILHTALRLKSLVSRPAIIPAGTGNPRRHSLHAKQHRVRRKVERLYQDGRLRAAVTSVDEEFRRSLGGVPQAPLDASRFEDELRNLNPLRDENDVLPLVDEENEAETCIKWDVVREVIGALPKGSANGCSGWTYSIIHALFMDAEEKDFQVVANLFTELAANRLSNLFWTQSRAVLLPKGQDKFRPLGIGEAWYRVLSRSLLVLVGSDLGRLAPIQLGCGVRGGCEIGGRLAQVMLDNDPDTVLLKTDFINAFNSPTRLKLFQGVMRYCKKLARWYRWAYGDSAVLRDSSGIQRGMNHIGCRQGDPLAPALFCMSIQDALYQIEDLIKQFHQEAIEDGQIPEGVRPGRIIGYMDDCTISCHYSIAQRIAEELPRIFGDCGLRLNAQKCRVVGSRANTLAGMPFPSCPEGDIILGNPVGSMDFRTTTVARLMQEKSASLPFLSSLGLREKTITNFLRFCYIPRAEFLARVHESNDCVEGLRQFDAAIDRMLGEILRHDPSVDVHANTGREEVSKTIRSLPLHHGGLGLRRLSWVPGQVGCWRSRTIVQEFVIEHKLQDDFARGMQDWRTNRIIEIGANCPLGLEAMENNPPPFSEDEDDDPAEAVYRSTAESLCSFLKDNWGAAYAALFRSNWFEGSGKWISPPLGFILPEHQYLTGEEYHAGLRTRMLLANSDAPVRCTCGVLADGPESLHFMHCGETEQRATRRHNAIVGIVEQFCKQNRVVEVIKEPILTRVIQDTTPGSTPILRGDLGGRLDNRPIIIDVSITNPACPSYRERAATISDSASRAREEVKRVHYEPTLAGQSGHVYTFSVEATGRMGPGAIAFVEMVLGADIAHNRNRWKRGRSPVEILQNKISTATVKYSSLMVLNRWKLAVFRARSSTAATS
jgi:hypothetical protein